MGDELTEVVHRALAGDGEALRALVRAVHPVIQARVARGLLRFRGAAAGRNVRQELDDMCQEIYVSLFENDCRLLRAWRPDGGLSLKGFVGLAADREVISIMRNGKRNPWKLDPTEPEALAETRSEANLETRLASRESMTVILDRLRETLSPQGLELFRLTILEEASVESVCTQTGLSADAVYAWRSRLVKRVKEIAASLLDDDANCQNRRNQREVPKGLVSCD